MSLNTRKISADIVYNVLRKKSPLSDEISNFRNANSDISSLDMRFISELTYGTMRNLGYLDYVISKASDIKINKISPYVLSVLRVGAYQIIYMDKVPVSAAVNESVKIIKKSSNSRLSGFVNAVLRKIDNIKKHIVLPENETQRLSVQYSCPKWIVEKLVETVGEDTEKLLMSLSKKAETVLRVNVMKTTADKLIASLNSKGWECSKYKSELFPNIDYLISAKKIDSIEATEEYQNGYFYIQDPAASYVGEILNPQKGSTVLDMCASPGGKTTHFAEKMYDTGKVLAFDISKAKTDKICENIKRLCLNCVVPNIKDSSVYDENLFEKADYLLVDSPCSGIGIIRKKPDIKYLRNQNDIQELRKISLKILDASARYLKKGGIMVFSTCTLFKEENEDVLFEFLKTHPEFKLKEINSARKNNGYMTLYPHKDNCDGFFISLMTKE